MRSWIDHSGEVVWEPAPSLVAQLVEAGQPFWLDIENPTDELIDQLATRLGLHPLAVEDSKQFGQRAKLQVYGNVAMLVGFGLDAQLREPIEVHCYYTTGFLVTLRRAPSPALDALRASLASKHLAVVSRRLADVATIFLPISFLAGFWGQNFNVLTGSIEKGWPTFLVLGVGLSVACVVVIVFMPNRRSWK